MVWKMLLEEFQTGFGLKHPIKFLLIKRRMLFDKYQGSCLVLGHPDILFSLSLHVCLVSAQEDIWF